MRLYSTLLPQAAGQPSEPRLASPRHGTLTPGRISAGRPLCLRLRLDGSIIIPGGVIAIQLATGCFLDGWTRLAPYLAVVDRGEIWQAVITEQKCIGDFVCSLYQNLYRWFSRILQRRLPFFRGPRQEGIQMIGYSVYKEHERKPPHSITR